MHRPGSFGVWLGAGSPQGRSGVAWAWLQVLMREREKSGASHCQFCEKTQDSMWGRDVHRTELSLAAVQCHPDSLGKKSSPGPVLAT